MQTDVPFSLDLDAYLSRIDHVGLLAPTQQGLESLHLAHATHIPFENLDILLGRPVRLDLDSLQAKLVRDRRGGYCFEQNTLFAAVLEQMGFQVTRLAARVRLAAHHVLPRTHMLLRVDVDGQPWLADVGFGGAGLLQPIPLRAGQTTQQFAWSYRLERDNDLWILQYLQQGAWTDLYAFTLEPQFPIDYEMANWFTSTHPDSIFVRMLLAQGPRPAARYRLRNREFTVEHAGGVAQTRTMNDEEDLLACLAETFGLVFPTDTRFRYREDS
jgi:N-hydroxyarylamine O-acetyltransferase